MKISNSKKQLARIINENGGWRDGAEWATQDHVVAFFSGGKPKYETYDKTWCANGDDGVFIVAMSVDGKIGGFHNTILSRAEYFHLYPAPDADGWIEWNGGECPVGNELRLDIKFSDGDVIFDADTDWRWPHKSRMCNIIAYRLHKQEQSKSAAVGDDETNPAAKEDREAVELGEYPEQRAKLARIYAPSIEQLMQIHCDRAHALSEKKAELIVAERQESEALDALKAACKEAGFDISPVERMQENQEPELVITDWRDLLVGDVVELISFQGGSARVGEIGKISKFFGNGDFHVDFPSQSGYSVDHSHIKFIRRP